MEGSELSVGIARAKFEKKINISFDTTQDTMEMMQIAQRTRNSGIITLGSTNSQNMVNVAEVSSYITRTNIRGHKYAISITTDSAPLDIRTPSFAGSHTSTFGKLLRGATTAYVRVTLRLRSADDHHGTFANSREIYEGQKTA
ncbi:MAG: deoxyhypusine synthase family protein [Chloracidobacterium sp.]|nr:deoxyhypusine synthase family protein [Chloracidobacterium sp.]